MWDLCPRKRKWRNPLCQQKSFVCHFPQNNMIIKHIVSIKNQMCLYFFIYDTYFIWIQFVSLLSGFDKQTTISCTILILKFYLNKTDNGLFFVFVFFWCLNITFIWLLNDFMSFYLIIEGVSILYMQYFCHGFFIGKQFVMSTLGIKK